MSLRRSALPALLVGCILLLCLGLSPAHQKIALAQPYTGTLRASPETSPLDVATYSQNIELVNHIPGTANEVALRGNYAYAGLGPGLAVIDISNPANPMRVGYLVLSHGILDIQLSGPYAYVLLARYGLVIVDVSDPVAPVQVGTFPIRYATELVVAGHHAYLAGEHGSELWVVDLSNPAAPTGFTLPNIGASSVAVQNNYLYYISTVSHDYRLVVLDITDPTAPTEVGNYDAPYGLYDVAVEGDYAYLIAANGLRIVNVSDPSHPQLESFLVLPGAAPQEIVLAGDYAYLRSGRTGIRIIDVADRRNPQEASKYDIREPMSMAVVGHYMVVADRSYGLRVFDISNPEVLTPVGDGWPVLPLGSSTVWVDGYLYAASEGDWKILDVSDPITPTVIGTFTADAVDWVVAGDYAYGINDLYQLNILDISDPTAPTQIGSFIASGGGFVDIVDIALYGDYAYLADVGECNRGGCFNGGVWVIDISNPAAPTQAGFVGVSTSNVTVVKDYLYRRSTSNALEALDLSDPAHPTSAGPLPELHWFLVEGDFLYSVQSGRLEIFDVSNPLVPVRRGSYPTFTYGPLTAVEMTDNRLYISGGTSPESDSSSVLTVVDVSNPDVPVGLGRYVGHYGTGLEASGDYIYSAGQALYVLHYTGGTLPVYASYLPLASHNR